MKLLDLGDLSGDVLLYGGAHSNAEALSALLAWAEARGIAPARMISTGDLVAYCGAPAPVVDIFRQRGLPTIAGNCERQLAKGAPDCGCGFEAGTTCDLLSAGWFGHADKSLDAEARAWMGDLADMAVLTHAGRRYAVIHGGATDISRFLWPVSAPVEFEEEIARITDQIGAVDAVVAGHCGLAFQRQIGAVTWVNAGAIGMPPHDGRPQTRFGLLSEDGVVFHRLEYDVKGAVADMERAGLTQGYQRTLVTGIWPSEDVLPPAMRRTGASRGI